MTGKPAKTNFLKTLGPGILFASTAIGVSHLVQSTRAGAAYGFTLLWAIILANLFKYPFFEYGSRYANVKEESIIDGYKSMGSWMLWLYFLIMLSTMFFVCAAVGAVTAGFMQNLFGLNEVLPENGGLVTNVFLTILCVIVLAVGKYNLLDKGIKLIGSVLLISTLTAFILTLINGPIGTEHLLPEFSWNASEVLFLIALMGWMPTAVDLSAWNSLWTVARIKETGYKPSLKETLREFNLGYIISAFLSICFLTLGAYMMYGTGKTPPVKGSKFAAEVVVLFTESIGSWSYIIISAAAFSIMLGTYIAVLDGYARAFSKTVSLMRPSNKPFKYNYALLVSATGGFGLIYYYLFSKGDEAGFKLLVDIATTLSFLVAPIIAIANFKLVNNTKFPKEARPSYAMKFLSYTGIIFLSLFSVYGLYIYFTEVF